MGMAEVVSGFSECPSPPTRAPRWSKGRRSTLSIRRTTLKLIGISSEANHNGTSRDGADRLKNGEPRDRRAVTSCPPFLHRSKANDQMLTAKALEICSSARVTQAGFCAASRRSTSHSRPARRRQPCRRTEKLGRSAGGDMTSERKMSGNKIDPGDSPSTPGISVLGERRSFAGRSRTP
jgi:hypothetical protein